MRHNVVVLLLIAMVALVEAQKRNLAFVPKQIRTWNVHVVNGLSNNVALTVHCKSKDDNLGNQNLAHVGDEFQWHFEVNIWGTTLFWCFLEKLGANVSFESFWSESKNLWLHHRCTTQDPIVGSCIWIAKDDGIYLKNLPDNVDELIHKWIATTA